MTARLKLFALITLCLCILANNKTPKIKMNPNKCGKDQTTPKYSRKCSQQYTLTAKNPSFSIEITYI